MNITAISTSISAFAATNLDDLVILMLFFAQSDRLRRQDIVSGQYLGFGLLVLASLPGFFGSLILPHSWIGLLGIMPIVLGLSRLFERNEAEEESDLQFSDSPTILSPQTYAVVALTVANGSDNIGIYMPLFANCTGATLLLTLGIFFTMLGVWCYAAYKLTHIPTVSRLLTHYGNLCVPYVLIALGMLILRDSQTLDDRGLTVIALLICGGYLLNLNLPKLEEN